MSSHDNQPADTDEIAAIRERIECRRANSDSHTMAHLDSETLLAALDAKDKYGLEQYQQRQALRLDNERLKWLLDDARKRRDGE